MFRPLSPCFRTASTVWFLRSHPRSEQYHTYVLYMRSAFLRYQHLVCPPVAVSARALALPGSQCNHDSTATTVAMGTEER
jgi:hypothetical protein